MKKIFILIGLFLTLTASGQILPGVVASQGGTSGPPPPSNILRDGTFANGLTYWLETDGTFDIGGGIASYTNVGYGVIAQDQGDMISGVEINTAYTLTFDLTISSGQANFRLRNYNGAVNYNSSSYTVNGGAGQHIHFTTPADIDGGGFRITGQPFGDNAWTIDNLILTKD